MPHAFHTVITHAGTRMEATITHFPSVGSVVFTQSFPDGVAHTFTGPPPGTPVAYRKWPVRGDVYTGDGEGHTDSVSVDESVEFVGGDEVSSTCTLKNNTDYHGHDIRCVFNVLSVERFELHHRLEHRYLAIVHVISD